MPAINPSWVSIDMVLAYNSGNFGTPVLNTVSARDVKLGVTWGEADVSNRGSKLELKEPTLQVREMVFDMVADETDPVFTAIRSAALARSAVELFYGNGPLGTAGSVASGGTANVVYSRCTFKVFGMERGEPLEGAVTVSYTLKPSKLAQTNAPTDNALVS